MKQANRLVRLLYCSMLGLFFASLLACGSSGGGGGGSSNSNNSVQAVTYVGKTDPVIVTDTNAKTLARAAMTSGGVSSLAPTGAVINTAPTSNKPVLSQIVNIMQNVLTRTQLNSSSVSGTHLDENVTRDCTVNGTTTRNITVNDATGQLTGSMSFNACQDSTGQFLSGAVTVTGQITDPNGLRQLVSLTSNGTLAFNDAQDSFTFTGILATTLSYDSMTNVLNGISILANVDVRNNNVNGEYLRLTNFTIAQTPDFTLTGTVCDSKEGCGTVATQTAFSYVNQDPWPSSGQLEFLGAGNTKVRLTTVNNTSYNLEWDDGTGMGYKNLLLAQPWSGL